MSTSGGGLGQIIKKARLSAGLTQEQAARVLNVSGSTISRWERGEMTPPANELRRVLARLESASRRRASV